MCKHRYQYTADGGGSSILGYIWDGWYGPDGYIVDIPVDANFSSRVEDLIVCGRECVCVYTYVCVCM